MTKVQEAISKVLGPSWLEIIGDLKAVGEALMYLLGNCIKNYINSNKAGYLFALLKRLSEGLAGEAVYQ